MTPSPYQQAVYDFIQYGEGHGVINAVAGSGKSTTINNSFAYIPESHQCLLLAFNKSIVEELKMRVSDRGNVTVSTLHSLGCKAIMKKYRVQIDGSKYSRFVNEYFDNGKNCPDNLRDWDDVNLFKQNIKRLIDLGRVNLCETEGDLLQIADKFDMDLLSTEAQFAMRFIKWGLQKEDTIDFTDMIYWPVVKKLWVGKYHWVFIDECQDLNAAQRELFLMCLRTDGRFIAVGDPHQAIYGFAGADVESFNILASLPGVKQFPLSVCYRCDSDIIQLAKKYVPQIEARDGAPIGTIDRFAHPFQAKSGDMVLCRFTKPLTQQCMDYIRSGIKARIQGRDIGANLAKMIRDTKLIYIEDIFEKLYRDFDKAAARYATRKRIPLQEAMESDTIMNHRDRIQTIEVLAEGLDTGEEIINRIYSIFDDNIGSGILLSTIHRSKGLEADRVFILEADNMVAKQAMKLAWSAEQEYNLQYVAFTRAKHYLGLIPSNRK